MNAEQVLAIGRDERVEPLVNLLAGLELLEADRTLDDARRLCMLGAYTGAGTEDVTARVQPGETAVQIASYVRGLTLLEAVQLIEAARTMLWVLRALEDDSSPVSRQFRARQAPDETGTAH